MPNTDRFKKYTKVRIVLKQDYEAAERSKMTRAVLKNHNFDTVTIESVVMPKVFESPTGLRTFIQQNHADTCVYVLEYELDSIANGKSFAKKTGIPFGILFRNCLGDWSTHCVNKSVNSKKQMHHFV